MLNLVDLVNPGYQKAVDAAGQSGKAAAAKEKEEPTTQTAGTSDQETTQKPSGDTYVPEDKEAVKAELEAAGKTYKPNTALVEQMKAEQSQMQTRFVNMVKDMLGKQGKTIAEGEGIWKTLAGGDFEVDEETRKAAQEAIAGDGYWGVEQTSERIVGFAKALVGGDPEKIQLLKDAFEKGYAAAEKSWGGALPEISQKTRGAVMDLFDQWEKEGEAGETEEGEADSGEKVDASNKTESEED